MRFDNFQCPARVLAPRAIGSCKSPSPANIYVNLFNDELDEAYSARAIPIPIPTPCPSGPVFASTPGVSISG